MSGKDHRKKKAGRKAEKRKTAEKKKKGVIDDEARKRNPKAFTYQSAGRAKAQRARTAEKDQRRLHGEHYSCC
jgi:ribosome biogenesis protein BMS1